MGLDYVELIMAIEDGFQIHIEDDEANNVSTVGDLRNLVVAKLEGPESQRCLTSAAFYRTRRGIAESLGIDRRQIRPSTSLETLLPRSDRPEKWRSIQRAMELELPDLVYRFEFPHNDATVGDLARDVLTANHARLAKEVGGWTKKDVWETLCRAIVEQTGIAREDVTPEARIMDDLRID